MKTVPNIEQKKKNILMQKLLPVEVNFLTHFPPIILGVLQSQKSGFSKPIKVNI